MFYKRVVVLCLCFGWLYVVVCALWNITTRVWSEFAQIQIVCKLAPLTSECCSRSRYSYKTSCLNIVSLLFLMWMWYVDGGRAASIVKCRVRCLSRRPHTQVVATTHEICAPVLPCIHRPHLTYVSLVVMYPHISSSSSCETFIATPAGGRASYPYGTLH